VWRLAQIMQRVGHLFQDFYSFQNLLLAWQKTRRGSGRNRESALFFTNLEKELLALRTELRSGDWQPRPYRYFDIYDPKHRTIAVSDYRDRVVHHALVNVLEPVFEKIFITDSFATRKGKGVHEAVFRAQHFLRGHAFFLKTDIEKFFDSVNHDLLLEIIGRKIKDRSLMTICEKIIYHGGTNGRGLPIGNRTSQFFANVYLDPLDHFIKDRCGLRGYVRYMDDFVLFENDKAHLKVLQSMTEDFLGEQLQLSLKPSATFLNRWENGLPFLGRRIFPGIIRLRTENLRRITRRIDLREKQFLAGDLEEADFLHSMNSYWAMLSFYPELKGLKRFIIDANNLNNR
jgi:RNA-directed DNA polymerase